MFFDRDLDLIPKAKYSGAKEPESEKVRLFENIFKHETHDEADEFLQEGEDINGDESDDEDNDNYDNQNNSDNNSD